MQRNGTTAAQDASRRAAAAVAEVEQLWTTQQAAHFLGVTPGALHQWRWRRQGPAAYRVGNGLRYDPAEVRRWLREECSEAG